MSRVMSHCESLAEAQELSEELGGLFPEWELAVEGFKDGRRLEYPHAVRADNNGESIAWFVVREKKELRPCPRNG